MNEDSLVPKIPDGFEDWSWEKKEAYLKGEHEQPQTSSEDKPLQNEAVATEDTLSTKEYIKSLLDRTFENAVLKSESESESGDGDLKQEGQETEDLIPDSDFKPEIEPEPMFSNAKIGPESASQPENASATQPTSELLTDEELVKLKELRNDLAKTEAQKNNFSIDTGFSLEDLKTKYSDNKEELAKAIRERARAEFLIGEGPLTLEQEGLINNFIFDNLIRKENETYLATLKSNRKETLRDQALETAKNLLGTKAVKWYLSLSRKQRMALSFGVGGLAGLALGAVAAPGLAGVGTYLAWRAARVGLSGSVGTLVGNLANKNKSWSIEELNSKENEEVEALKNSDLSLDEKSKGFEDIKQKYKKERLKAAAWKIGLTTAAGAGTGLLTGLAEQITFGSGGATNSALESKSGKIADITEDKLPPRKGFEPTPVKISATPESTESPKSIGRIISDPEILIHNVKGGDSSWKILEHALTKNEQFSELTEAQKTYVLSTLTNKMLKSPTDYGLRSDGSIHVGDKTDFTKLFEDDKGLKSLFSKAKQTIVSGSPQEASIITNNQKIALWIKENPSAALTDDKIAEILSAKPKPPVVPEIESTKIPSTPLPSEPELELSPEPELEPEPKLNQAPEILPEKETPEIKTDSLAKSVEEQTVQEIELAKKRLTELENPPRNPNLERSFAYDTKLTQGIEEAFRSEIDSIYGQKGFMGFGKTPGVATKEWGEMARLPANKVVEYYTGDSTKSGLPAEIIEKLSKSKRHGDLMKQTVGLMEQTDGLIKPFENENMEQFIKRLGGYILRSHSQNLAKAA